MNTAEFLFPIDLEVTPLARKKVLVVGSCLAEAFVTRLRTRDPQITYQFDLFNNASDLPHRSDDEISEFDYQYLQISLRSVLTDAAVRIAEFDRMHGSKRLLDIGKRNIDAMLAKALEPNRRTGLLTLVASFIVPQGFAAASLSDLRTSRDLRWLINALNDYLAASIASVANVFFADIDMIAETVGKRYFLDDIISFNIHGSLFYTDWHHFEGLRIEPVRAIGETYENKIDDFFDAVFRQIESLVRVANQIDMVKVVIFDLDNTMWRGQMVEDYQVGAPRPGIDGWPLGVWDAVNQLRWRGIVVAIASKNDLHLVEEKWGGIVDPPFVEFEDFLIKEINWGPKSESVRRILSLLSLTDKSAVFVDDSPVEREAVKAAFPNIRVIGSDPFLTKRILLWSAETRSAFLSQESENRETMLQKQFERETFRSETSHEEFLASLGSKVKLWSLPNIDHPTFGRVFELVNKTNQFNTNGKRWTLDDYARFFAQNGRLMAFSVADRFTDYGTVGAVFVSDSEIEQYVMSCRVLGMEIEDAVISAVADLVKAPGRSLRAHIIETPSNTPCRSMYTKLGFEPGSTPGHFIQRTGVDSKKQTRIELTIA